MSAVPAWAVIWNKETGVSGRISSELAPELLYTKLSYDIYYLELEFR